MSSHEPGKKGENVFFIGDTEVRILIPSRRADGGIVDPELRREWDSRARKEFETEPFGGATPMNTVGSYVHVDGRITREDITILSSICHQSVLNNKEALQRILRFAQELAAALGQETIFVGWGPIAHLVQKSYVLSDVTTIPFNRLPLDDRVRHLTMCWGGLREAQNILQVLSLDTWKEPTTQQPKGRSVRLCAELAEEKGIRRAWSWKREQTPPVERGGDSFRDVLRQGIKNWSDGDGPRAGDLIFTESASDRFDMYLVTQEGVVGPRDLVLSHGRMNPVTRDLLLYVLQREWDKLSAALTQQPLDKTFFPKLRRLQVALAKDLESHGQREAFRLSILIIGRMMFLRFLAQKGENWLPGGVRGLQEAWEKYGDDFFAKYLRPLWFEVLGRAPHDRRESYRKAFAKYPFLGGLFVERDIDLGIHLNPDRFSPQIEGSFLDLFTTYEFSLNEYAGSDDSVKVDPSLFGKVLETFNNEMDQKKEGVHYTPKPIAWALALESIVSRLSSETGIDRASIEGLLQKQEPTVCPADAQRIQEKLQKLRVVDPAVGSGVLLWACLDVMMTIDSRCDAIAGGGQGYQHASYRWGQRSRLFVEQCLHGVDISQEGIELTRLRLWLAVAMSEHDPVQLPNLTDNFKCGDSLGPWVEPSSSPPAANTRSKHQRKTTPNQGTLALTDDQVLRQEIAERQQRLDDGDAGGERQRLLDEILERKRRLMALDVAHENVPFNWATAFPKVFQESNAKRGFDIVIANPPYVRVQNVSKESVGTYRKEWLTLGKGNTDLSFAFVELALRRLTKVDRGEVAFILPNFRSNDSAAELRGLVVGNNPKVPTLLRLWVDFGDKQVFPTATNYVAMLFAQRLEHANDRDVFEYSTPGAASWSAEGTSTAWLRPKDGMGTNGRHGEWLTIPVALRNDLEQARRRCPRRLGEFVKVSVGIQTSCDEVFLFDGHREVAEKGHIEVQLRGGGSWVKLERDAVRHCLKGSAKGDFWMLFPYDRGGELCSEAWLKTNWPLAFAYLRRHKAKLESRESGKFKGDGWYRFGRAQGQVACRSAKVLVPALLKTASAELDADGSMVFTASGKGGGGAFALTPLVDGVKLDSIHAAVASPDAWAYMQAHGSPQKDGWFGVDGHLLENLPCPDLCET